MTRGLTRRQLLLGAAGGLAATALGSAYFLVDPMFAPLGRVSARPLPVGDRSPILVLAPHPDDEVLGSGGYWKQMLSAGSEVHVLVVTSGDAFRADVERLYYSLNPTPADYLRTGERRMRESRTAVRSLGLDASRVRFLGLPDEGTNHLFLDNWERAYRSPFTKRDSAPYPEVEYPGLPYTGEAALSAIYTAILRIRPAVLILPHPNDLHPDHWAVSAFASAAIEMLRQEGHRFVDEMVQYNYLVHWGDWPLPMGYHPGLPLLPPWEFDSLNTTWYRYRLPVEVVAEKERAIRDYQTQMLVVGRRLEAFARRNELFGLVPAHIVPPWEGSYERLTAVLRDPKDSFVSRLLGATGGFIQEVRMGQDPEQIHIAIDLTADSADLVLRSVIMAVGPGSRYVRRQISVGPKVGVRLFSDQGEIPHRGITAQFRPREMRMAVPKALLEGASDFLYGILSFRAGHYAGKTGFRVLRLSTAAPAPPTTT